MNGQSGWESRNNKKPRTLRGFLLFLFSPIVGFAPFPLLFRGFLGSERDAALPDEHRACFRLLFLFNADPRLFWICHGGIYAVTFSSRELMIPVYCIHRKAKGGRELTHRGHWSRTSAAHSHIRR